MCMLYFSPNILLFLVQNDKWVNPKTGQRFSVQFITLFKHDLPPCLLICVKQGRLWLQGSFSGRWRSQWCGRAPIQVLTDRCVRRVVGNRDHTYWHLLSLRTLFYNVNATLCYVLYHRVGSARRCRELEPRPERLSHRAVLIISLLIILNILISSIMESNS